MLNLTSPIIVKSLLEQYNIIPSKRLGQNFLIDKNILDKIVATSDLSEHDIVIEVGPGVGALTQELATRVKKVIAIEKDRKMCEILREVLKDFHNIEIVNEDILKWDVCRVCDTRQNYKVIANLPYYITSPVIRKFLESLLSPDFMVFMVQKEVGERIIAQPPHMSILAVSVQLYAQPKIVAKVSKNCFLPAPNVDSAIVKIDVNRSLCSSADKNKFFQLVKAGFAQKRKLLISNITKGLSVKREVVEQAFEKSKINVQSRAQELAINQWITLLQEIEGYIIMKAK